MNEVIQQRVVCAAIRGSNGHIICSARHYDKLMHEQLTQCKNMLPKVEIEQGFIDQWGVFMNRKEALAVALAADQRIRRCGGDEQQLYSENLY